MQIIASCMNDNSIFYGVVFGLALLGIGVAWLYDKINN